LLPVSVRPTIRLRLTAWYAACFLGVGVVLLGLSYVLVGRSLTDYQEDVAGQVQQRARQQLAGDFPPGATLPPPDAGDLVDAGEQRRIAADAKREQLQTVTVRLLGALGGLVVLSIGGGWVVAGRALRPVSQITAAARVVSDGRLHERLAFEGPDDELKELADTFDEMLLRLDRAFEQQARFVDSASHELRTPLAVMRGALDSVLDDPNADEHDLRRMATVLSAAVDRSEHLAASLLLLARSGGELRTQARVDLAELCDAAAAHHAMLAADRQIRVETSFGPAVVRGDAVLLEQLIDNLLHNGLRYNSDRGWISIGCQAGGGSALIEVENTGPRVRATDLPLLFMPFGRLDGSRGRDDGGAGLGLAIVQRIALAHGGEATATPRPTGGLRVCVRLPAAA
jgi:signal transduction histidine kinase